MEDENGKNTDVLPMELPQFYHERISYQMGCDFARLNRRAMKLNLFLETTVKEDATPEERLRVQVAQSEAMDEADEIADELQAFMASIIKSIPRTWLIEGAPAKINDGEWLQWVRRDRYAEVSQAYQDAGALRREETKN
jgi:hypothetical protein